MSLDLPVAPIFNITGKRIALGPLRHDLLETYARWRNDFWIQRTYGQSIEAVSMEAMGRWYEGESTATAAKWFTVYERESGEAIGLTDLFNMEMEHGLAWFGMVIGESSARGKGYAAEVTSLMLDYAFTALNLNVVVLSVDEFNIAGRKAYERAGFRESGRMSEATLVAGKRYDRIMMECLARTFESPVLRAILEPPAP